MDQKPSNFESYIGLFSATTTDLTVSPNQRLRSRWLLEETTEEQYTRFRLYQAVSISTGYRGDRKLVYAYFAKTLIADRILGRLELVHFEQLA